MIWKLLQINILLLWHAYNFSNSILHIRQHNTVPIWLEFWIFDLEIQNFNLCNYYLATHSKRLQKILTWNSEVFWIWNRVYLVSKPLDFCISWSGQKYAGTLYNLTNDALRFFHLQKDKFAQICHYDLKEFLDMQK